MYAVEFQAKMKDGIIRVPEKYRKKIGNRFKVILLAEEASETSSDIIEHLLACPMKLPDFIPLKRKEIYDRT
ncbi:hypothetical protein TI05_12835 [Achromatium sp. WMS3]|nr:hypothetical protein TI05_12835 [Achromatium sp. WMS3]